MMFEALRKTPGGGAEVPVVVGDQVEAVRPDAERAALRDAPRVSA
jgi:hypothetical protein